MIPSCHGSHRPGILLKKLLGPWKLRENEFLFENTLNLYKRCLDFIKNSYNAGDYHKISPFWHQEIEGTAEKRVWILKPSIPGQFTISYSKYLINLAFNGVNPRIRLALISILQTDISLSVPFTRHFPFPTWSFQVSWKFCFASVILFNY